MHISFEGTQDMTQHSLKFIISLLSKRKFWWDPYCTRVRSQFTEWQDTANKCEKPQRSLKSTKYGVLMKRNDHNIASHKKKVNKTAKRILKLSTTCNSWNRGLYEILNVFKSLNTHNILGKLSGSINNLPVGILPIYVAVNTSYVAPFNRMKK